MNKEKQKKYPCDPITGEHQFGFWYWLGFYYDMFLTTTLLVGGIGAFIYLLFVMIMVALK